MHLNRFRTSRKPDLPPAKEAADVTRETDEAAKETNKTTEESNDAAEEPTDINPESANTLDSTESGQSAEIVCTLHLKVIRTY